MRFDSIFKDRISPISGAARTGGVRLDRNRVVVAEHAKIKKAGNLSVPGLLEVP
jgi:hypothetical protein